MQKVLTSEEMREIDRLTTEKYGIPPIMLMENAAHAAARVIAEKLGGSVDDRSILVMCGKGNNGGDGAALARILWQQGADVEVCLFGLVDDTKDDARTNFQILQKISGAEAFEIDQADLAFEEITGIDEWMEYDSLNFHSEDPDVIVDALFGTGLKRPLDGVYAEAAAFISAFNNGDEEGPLIVSLDVPSGLDADSGDVIGVNPKAHVTVTYTAAKAANVLPPASNFAGELYIEKIGSPCDLVNAAASQLYLAELDDACKWLRKTEFTSDSYKNKRGHALVIGGSARYSGAVVLAGNAAIRSGTGLVTVITPSSSRDSVASRLTPEVMVRGVAETPAGAVSGDAFPDFEDLFDKADAVLIGCGLSKDEGTLDIVKKVINDRRRPTVVDADALNLLAPLDHAGLNADATAPLILTPHNREFMRLLGTEDSDAIKDRVSAVHGFSQKHGVILVLKGERPLIAEPGGCVVISPTGNTGLGKAGNGDTLAGIIAGFCSQAAALEIDIFESVVAAVYIAGLAGDIAEKQFGKRVMTASDVRDCLGDAFEIVGR